MIPMKLKLMYQILNNIQWFKNIEVFLYLFNLFYNKVFFCDTICIGNTSDSTEIWWNPIEKSTFSI